MLTLVGTAQLVQQILCEAFPATAFALSVTENRYAVTRIFDGYYASVECVTPEQAAQALSVSTRAEFEEIVSPRAARLADDAGVAQSEDGDGTHAIFLSVDVDAQSSPREGGRRADGVQLPLF